MKTVNIYTDGACREIQVGGWGVLIEYGDTRKEYFVSVQHNKQSNGLKAAIRD